jgi:predicted small secreted protein
MKTYRSTPLVLALAAFAAAACNKEQRADVDTAAGNVASAVTSPLTVIDIDMGRHVDAEQKISDKTDDFAAKDTIYASVHTSGTASNGAVVARWTGPDGSVIDEKTNTVTTNGDARTSFFIAKPDGLAAGKYTVHILIDGKEVRTKDVTVK